MQHRRWEQLTARIGPTGTLAELAAQRARTNDPSAAAAIDTAMTRRRDVIVAEVRGADTPPRWAQSLLATPTWAPQAGHAERERDVVANVAVYRDRFGVQGEGLGALPSDRDVQRVWRSLRSSLHLLGRRGDDRDDDRHVEVERDRGMER